MTSVTDAVVIGAGQSGLAAARALQAHGIAPVVRRGRRELVRPRRHEWLYASEALSGGAEGRAMNGALT